MPDSMVELFHRRRAQAAARSITASENNEQYLHNKAETTRELIGNTGEIDEDAHYTRQLAFHYYEMKARYYGKSTVTRVTHSKKSENFWKRVQLACKTSGVTPERYMKAQFDFFNVAFGTVPKINQLITEAAIERAREFAGKTEGRVVSNAIEAKVDLGAVFKRCEQQIRDICRAQKLTRKEYYQHFVLTKLISMPKQFLDADPVYQEVIRES